MHAFVKVRRYAIGHSPAWRWDCAIELVGMRHRPPGPIPDAPIARAVDYLRRLRRAKRPETAGPAHPRIVEALAIRDRNEPQRWELEALLLAGATTAMIARKLGLGPELIDTYADLLYDVRSTMHARDWILFGALGMGPWENGQPPESVLWGYGGWMHGPLLVDLLAGEYLGRAEPANPDRALIRKQAILCLQLHGVQAYDPRVAARLFDQIPKLFPHVVADRHGPDPRWLLRRSIIHLAAGRGTRPSVTHDEPSQHPQRSSQPRQGALKEDF